MCLSHPHRKTSFTQQGCEITMFQDWSWGGGQFRLPVGRNLGALRWHQAERTTPEFIRKSVFHLGSDAEIKQQVALMADSHTHTHTHATQGEYQRRKQTCMMEDHSGISRGAVLKNSTLVLGECVLVIPTFTFPCWARIKVKTVSFHCLHRVIV